MQAFGAQPPYAIFCDSLEVYNQDWSSDFLAEFKQRRGYDLKPYLPALIADIGPKTESIRHDWGETITDLFNERFLVPLHDWSQRNHTRLRMQDYGIPAATLSSNAYVDLPEGEGPQWKVLCATRWASSASHLYGRPVTSSETWTWLHSPVFRASPLDVKAEADLHFLVGINQLIGHGWPYTPPSVEYPGWRFYAAGVFNEKNPWWIVMPDLALYLQRVSFLLRQGQPANDVALYLPNNDAWAHFSPGHVSTIETLRERLGPAVIPKVMEAGFGFDVIDDEALHAVGKVEGNTLRIGSGTYRAVILPGVERMPIETMRALEGFVRGGGVVIATRRLPELAPGFKATGADHAQLREISQRLFQGPAAPGHFVRDEDAELSSTLGRLLHPDVAISPASADIGFVHRHTDTADIYFVANTSNVRRRADATFRVTAMSAELWDPIHGSVTPAQVRTAAGGVTTIALDLAPYGSRVLVFSKREGSVPQKTNAAALAASQRAPVAPELDLSADWTCVLRAERDTDHLRSTPIVDRGQRDAVLLRAGHVHERCGRARHDGVARAQARAGLRRGNARSAAAAAIGNAGMARRAGARGGCGVHQRSPGRIRLVPAVLC